MEKRVRFLILSIVLPFLSYTQTLNGSTGLLNIPSADMQADGTFIVGTNYLPAINQPRWNYNTANYYFDLTFLPFLEITYKCTLIKTLSSGRYTQQDRSINLRMQLMKEKKYLPAMVAGIHDIYTHTNGNQYFGASYIVLTKHIEFKNNILGITSGYGMQLLRNNEFVGLYGGFSFTPAFFKPITLMGEYDRKGTNLGGSLFLVKHLYLFSMAQQMKYLSGGIAYRFYLK
jgi:hypothetical protein